MTPSSLPLAFAAFLALFMLTTGNAHAAGGVTVSQGAAHDLLVTIDAEAANVHFGFNPQGCNANIPCLEIFAGQGLAGVPMSAGGNCHVEMVKGIGPGTIACPASGVSAITFAFKKGGTWAAYTGGGGEHAGGPCSPAPVTIHTGPGGAALVINTWNGCQETVVCDSPPTVLAAVESDAADIIKGKCASLVRH